MFPEELLSDQLTLLGGRGGSSGWLLVFRILLLVVELTQKIKGKESQGKIHRICLVRKSNNDEGLVSAWEPLVIRAKKNPGGLLKRLQGLVRAVADSRFCTTAGWTTAKQQPGPFARKWCSSVALWILCGYIEGHCI